MAGDRVLLVDDDAAVLRAYTGVLRLRGFAVSTARDGAEARTRLEGGPFDVVVSDLNMPGEGGLEFLRAVRARDLDVPIVLMTGDPTVATSIRAIEYGAFRYLIKPVTPDELAEVVRHATRLHLMARLKREALELAAEPSEQLGDRAALEGRFAIALDRLWMAFQPIVSWRERAVFGHEALVRSDEPSLGNPGLLLDAAERLARFDALGRAVRGRVAAAEVDAPLGTALFVNLHSTDLADDDLLDADSPLAEIAPRVVLEITERASLDDIKDVPARVARLREMGFRIAVDDLGAGYAGLSSFTQLEPHIAKLDMSLVRGIDTQVKKQSIVRSMAKLCAELGIVVVAEGVETEAERDTLVELGCDLLQGYLFARPARGFAPPRW